MRSAFIPGATLHCDARVAIVLAGMLFMVSVPGALKAAPIDTFHNLSCTESECHPSDHSDPSVISHPSFLEQWCDRCHVDHSSSNEMLLKLDRGELCQQCHATSETEGHSVVHPPGGGTCVDCHSPHQSSVRHLLRNEEMLKDCAQCHEGDLREAADKPFRHRFFTPQTECASCHYAHRGAETGYMRENLGETCLTCHDMNIRVDGRALENIGTEIRTAPHVHQPLRDNACHECHTPHGSVQPSLLREDYPAGNYAAYDRANYQLCWKCHDAQIVESSETTTATDFRNGSQNLHSLHVLQSKRGRACHLCHSAHASERPHLIRSTMTFGSWSGDFGFEASANGGTCTTACHRPREYNRSAR
jgi:predicted CXXCH cytochrome family protein